MFAATSPVSGKAVNFCVHGANWEIRDALGSAEKGEQNRQLSRERKFEEQRTFLPYDFLCLLFKEAAVNIEMLFDSFSVLHDERCSDSTPFRLKSLKHQRGQWLFLGWCSGTTLK